MLFIGRTRHRLPPTGSQERKWDALGEQLEVRVLGTAAGPEGEGDERFHLVRPVSPRALDPPAFYGLLPFRIARELRTFRPEAVVTQSPYEGAAALVGRTIARARTPVIVDVHGDWRTLSRLYGSPRRRTLSRPGDAVAAWALRRADAVRTISAYTTGLVRELGIEPAAEFPAFMDLEPFLGPPLPLPDPPSLLYVGVLERYKNVDGLAHAWRSAAPRLQGLSLTIVGDGSLRSVVESLVADLPGQVTWKRNLTAAEVAAELDAATALLLPSRSEGLGRIVVEALARGRPVVASSAGGIPDLVRDGLNGVLFAPGDDVALAAAMVRVVREPALAERLAAAARESVEPWLATPEEYAERVLHLVEGARR